MREALADGTIDAIATDHAPHASLDKEVEFDQAANGMVGLETALPLTLELVRGGRPRPGARGGAAHLRARRAPSGCPAGTWPRARRPT